MSKLIIGFVGQPGAGKGTAAEILKEKFGADIFTYSDILQDVLKDLYLPASRENLQTLSTNLRQAFGQDVFANAMANKINTSSNKLIIVDGIRRPDDIRILSDMQGFNLVEISAPMEIRFERLKKRNQKPGEGTMTWDEFLIMSQREPEQKIAEVSKMARHKIENDGDIASLSARLDELFAKLS